METLYAPDSFSLGFIIGFFLIVGFCGEGMAPDFLLNSQRVKGQWLYLFGNRMTMWLCFLAGVYIFYTQYLIFVGYFAALLAGAIAGQLFVIGLSLFGFLGTGIVYCAGGLSAFITGYVVWLYYTNAFVQKIGTIDLLKYLPGA